MALFARLVRPQDTVIDVGGHIGYLSQYFAQLVGRRGQVIVFEPGPNNLPYTRANLRAKPNVRLEVYDPAMCCSTGVCGPDVDPVLVRFAADLKWLQEQGAEVQRFNLSQSPAAFVENEQVKQALTERGEAALPMILAGSRVVSNGRYPEREELANWVGLTLNAPGIYSPVVNELVAIGAAIAANCEPCLKYHYREAQQLGVSKADMARAVETGAKVKDSPHQAILKLADRLTGATLGKPSAEPDACCGVQAAIDAPGSGKCCG
jgi:FkbM family methyltransferase